jgi:hypothetical protein
MEKGLLREWAGITICNLAEGDKCFLTQGKYSINIYFGHSVVDIYRIPAPKE